MARRARIWDLLLLWLLIGLGGAALLLWLVRIGPDVLEENTEPSPVPSSTVSPE